jgi:chaperonin GroEL
MLFQTNKPKSASKIMVPPGKALDDLVIETLERISEMAGATLGPSGRQILIERSEMGMKPIMTKDGVTVVKNLGFRAAIPQLILEAARDAAMRTASEAGDGTTTATILSASIARQTAQAVRSNPRLSPQRIVREMQSLVPIIDQFIAKHVVEIDAENAQDVMFNVAKLSGNGDVELANKIVEAMDLVGDEGNLTIVEKSDGTGISVERIKGYSLESGFEASLRGLSNGFLNDKSGTMVVLDKPVVVMYDGVVNDLGQILDFVNKMANHFAQTNQLRRGLVIIAHGWAEPVVGDLHVNWQDLKSPVQILPLLTPDKAIMNWRSQLLHDLAAYTGGSVFNPVDRPLVDADPTTLSKGSRVGAFECTRFSTNIIADEDESAISLRVEELKAALERPESEYEANDLQVRLGKLTSGIARMVISGPSAVETRERRDRAEDAWMAIRGAIRHGAVPGGGFVLVKLSAQLLLLADKAELANNESGRLALNILANALLAPVDTLYRHYGYDDEAIERQKVSMLKRSKETFDILEQRWVPIDQLLDSAPAVSQAIRNSISIASMFGTIGGVIAFERDGVTDKAEEDFVRRFTAASGERTYQ